MQRLMILSLTTLLMCGLAGPAEARKCKKDAVKVGDKCLDKYENSVWKIDPDTCRPPLVL